MVQARTDWQGDAMKDVGTKSEKIAGIDVPAGEVAYIPKGKYDAEYYGVKASIEWNKDIDLNDLGFKGTGNEYDEYIKANKKQ